MQPWLWLILEVSWFLTRKLLTSWKPWVNQGSPGEGNMYGTPCASSSQLSNSRWLSAQPLGCPRSTPPLHTAGTAPEGMGGFGAQLWHRVAARSGANGAGQKRSHQGPRCKPVWSAGECRCHRCEILQPLTLNQLLKWEKIVAIILGYQIWQICSSHSENINTFRESNDTA